MPSVISDTRDATNPSTAIQFDPARRQWTLSSGNALYVIGLRPDGTLRHRYLGPREGLEPGLLEEVAIATDRVSELERRGDVQDWEFPARGPMVFQETALAAVFDPSDRELQLVYSEHEVGPHGQTDQLRIRLADRFHPLVVDLYYQVAGDYGVFRRWAVVRNTGDAPITLEQAASFTLARRAGRHVLHHLAGAWANEMNPIAETLYPGRKVIESRRGYTGHVHQPWFALTDTEAAGTVFGALEWSGNWKISIDCDIAGQLAITGGLNDADFAHILQSGASFTTPVVVLGATAGDLDDTARALHRYLREHALPRRPSEDVLPIVFEGWYTTYGHDMGTDRLIREARMVADVGVELFIVTAGWYTNLDAADAVAWCSREGDWYAHPKLYPHGLEEVADAVRKLGMRFGLWWEPEAVATDSDVFASHPEWVYQARTPGPEPHLGRYVLNLARPDVYQHVRDDIFRLVQQYHLDYFRTDMNRPWSALADPSGASGPGRDLVWRHVNAYYRILDEVRAAFPDLIIENCAGGGGRIDLGLLRRTHTTWISDNVDPLYRLSMFLGGTVFVPPMVCESWVVTWPGRERSELPVPGDWPRPDLDFHFRVSMLGHLGVGADLERWPEEYRTRARHHIARYKALRRTIQRGDLYRLTAPPPRDGRGDWAAAAFVAPDRQEAAAFCFRLASERDSFRVRIPGLVPAAEYDVEVDGGSDRWRSRGADLAADGVQIVLPDRYTSALVVARRHA